MRLKGLTTCSLHSHKLGPFLLHLFHSPFNSIAKSLTAMNYFYGLLVSISVSNLKVNLVKWLLHQNHLPITLIPIHSTSISYLGLLLNPITFWILNQLRRPQFQRFTHRKRRYEEVAAQALVPSRRRGRCTDEREMELLQKTYLFVLFIFLFLLVTFQSQPLELFCHMSHTYASKKSK